MAVAHEWKVQQDSFGTDFVILGSLSWAILWLWYIFYCPEQWKVRQHEKSDNTGNPKLLYIIFSWQTALLTNYWCLDYNFNSTKSCSI